MSTLRNGTARWAAWPCGLLFAGGLALANAAGSAPLWWIIDTTHTQIHFQIDHQGFSRATGRVPVTQGWLQLDPDHPEGARVDVMMDLTRVDMGDDTWSQAVRSRQFLNAARHVQARFNGIATEMDADGHFLIRGELDLHGQRHPITLDARLNRVAHDPYRFRRVVGFSASGTLERSQFGMKRYQQVVGDEVQLEIEVEALQARDIEIPMEVRNGFEK